MWLSKYPWMTKEDFVPFSEFYKRQIIKEISQTPAEVLLAEAAEIRRKLGR